MLDLRLDVEIATVGKTYSQCIWFSLYLIRDAPGRRQFDESFVIGIYAAA